MQCEPIVRKIEAQSVVNKNRFSIIKLLPLIVMVDNANNLRLNLDSAKYLLRKGFQPIIC